MSIEVEERFWSKVEITDNCWNWRAGDNGHGYGLFWYGKKYHVAHRFSLKLFNIEIPQGLEVDHLCRNRGCVNPNHMELVTRRENVIRGILPGMTRAMQLNKTHCPQGHPYDSVNTYIRPQAGRGCRTCIARRTKEWRTRQANG